ncbi:Mediator of RNA polymerase II transcription subunit 13-like protein, partial [Stegodyphus mimosarum]
MEGKLTGVGYKYSDTNMANLLNSWHQFYPYAVRKDKMKIDNELPNVVEVITAGTRMKYPTAYVFVTDEDHSEAIQNPAGPTVSTRVQPLKLNHIPATGLLTPPMSPSENLSFNENSKLSKDILDSIANTENEEKNKRKYTFNTPECIKHSICQECYL